MTLATRVAAIAAGLVAVTAIATIAYLAGARRSRAQTAAARATEGAARATTAARSVPRLITAERTLATTPPGVADDVGPADDDEPRDRAHRAFLRYFAQLEAERTREPPDPSWSPRTERLIRSFADGERRIAGVSLEGACGPTICRAELRSGDERLRASLQRQFHRFVGRELPTMTLHVPPGEGMSVMYLARAGTSLPAMSQDDLRAMN